jgi:hypothetical protein
MPNLVTSLVSTPNYAQHAGPFEIGADLYAAAFDESGGTDKVRMYKSADGGGTWTEQDAANAPSSYSNAFGNGHRFIDVQQAGATLYVGFLSTGGAFHIAPFTSDTWDSIISGGPTLGGVSIYNSFVRRSAGEYLIFYAVAGVPPLKTMTGALYSGGSWGSPFTVTSANAMIGAVSDSSGRSLIFFEKGIASGGVGGDENHLLLRTYTAGNVLSADFDITADLNDLGLISGLPAVYTNADGLEVVSIAYVRAIQFEGTLDESLTMHSAFATARTADSPVFTLEEISYMNNPIGIGAYFEQDFVICSNALGEAVVVWMCGIGPAGLQLVSNRKDSCSNRWASLNSVLFDTVIGTSPSDTNNVEMVEGRYLPTRNKIGLLVYLNTTSGFGVYYMEF